MLRHFQIVSNLTEICRIGSSWTSKVVHIILNIDSGGRGDVKEGYVKKFNIFGEDCLGPFNIAKSDVFADLSFRDDIVWIRAC